MATQKLAVAALALGFAGVAAAQTKWDLPAAYSPANFHTENLVQFADDVDKATGGKLKITVHSKLRSSKRPRSSAPCRAPSQAGESCLVNFENENPLFGVDGVPFLATSYANR